MIKKWFLPTLLIIVLFISFFIYNTYRVAPHIKFNTLNLVDLNNQPINLELYKGKKLLICFSASWCPNCIEELDELKSIKSTELADVDVIVISDESIDKINEFKLKRGLPFTFFKMNASFSSIGINSIPTSYIINKKFEVMQENIGYLNWRDPSTCQHLKKLME